jgi:isocitrate/isopropylmalate dehydrogenase
MGRAPGRRRSRGRTHHTPIPEETLESIRRTCVSLKGPLTTPVGTGFRSINVALRKEFDLYANVRPALTLMTGGRYEDIDLVLIRENTEGLYVGVEHYIGVGEDPKAAAESVMIITRYGAERIVRYAFEYAASHGRRKVTLAHKANILKYTQGLFLDVGREIAEGVRRPRRVRRPHHRCHRHAAGAEPYQFDVLVMENMFGDILSDQMAGLVGGLGMAPGGNIGKTRRSSNRCTAPRRTLPAAALPTPRPWSWPRHDARPHRPAGGRGPRAHGGHGDARGAADGHAGHRRPGAHRGVRRGSDTRAALTCGRPARRPTLRLR